jgi:chromosome segregation ATPase
VAIREHEVAATKLEADLADTRSVAEDRRRECDQLAATLEAESAAAARSHAHATSLTQELEALRTAVRENDAATTKLRADLDNAHSAASSRKNELDKLSREVASAQSVVKDRDSAVERLLRDLDATRSYLREGQTEVQRLAGELHSARTEVEQAKVERESLSAAFAATSIELERARSSLAKLQKEHDGLRLAASQSPALRAQLVALKEALVGAREEADRSGRRISELSTELQSTVGQWRAREQILDRAARGKDLAAAALAVRIHELETRLAETMGERDYHAAALARTAIELRRAEENATDHARTLEAVHAAALAEGETKAKVQIRTLRDQLIDAEAAAAKARRTQSRGAWTTPFSKSRRAARLLKNSGLLEAEWYLREYPDVATSSRSPAEHYMEEGYLRGYRPNPFFDTRWYLERYDDVRRAGINPAFHYLMYGSAEGRDPGPNFHTNFYLQNNPDVRENGMNPLAHFLRYGRHEGRLPTRPV